MRAFSHQLCVTALTALSLTLAAQNACAVFTKAVPTATDAPAHEAMHPSQITFHPDLRSFKGLVNPATLPADLNAAFRTFWKDYSRLLETAGGKFEMSAHPWEQEVATHTFYDSDFRLWQKGFLLSAITALRPDGSDADKTLVSVRRVNAPSITVIRQKLVRADGKEGILRGNISFNSHGRQMSYLQRQVTTKVPGPLPEPVTIGFYRQFVPILEKAGLPDDTELTAFSFREITIRPSKLTLPGIPDDLQVIFSAWLDPETHRPVIYEAELLSDTDVLSTDQNHALLNDRFAPVYRALSEKYGVENADGYLGSKFRYAFKLPVSGF